MELDSALAQWAMGNVDQGTDFRVAFWVNGQDDGMNKYTSDGLFAVWNAFKANDITIPFPHAAVAFKGSLPT
jgi:small-conductance mechanosensitive channel